MDEYIKREDALNIIADIMQDCKVSHKHRALNRNIKQIPTADVVPKSEVERLTINMNAYGLTAKRLAEENESLEIELENMRRNLGDAREGWNDAECEVERLREINSLLTEAGQEWKKRYDNAKAEVAREIFEEIENIIRKHDECPNYRLMLDLAKLKKKYTEEKREKV